MPALTLSLFHRPCPPPCSPYDTYSWIPGAQACLKCVQGKPHYCASTGCTERGGTADAVALTTASTPGARPHVLRPAGSACWPHTGVGWQKGSEIPLRYWPVACTRSRSHLSPAYLLGSSPLRAGGTIAEPDALATCALSANGVTAGNGYAVPAYTNCDFTATPGEDTVHLAFEINGVSLGGGGAGSVQAAVFASHLLEG
mgnify:CR=1 FL=1